MNQECCILGDPPHSFPVQVLEGTVGTFGMLSGPVCSQPRR